MEGLERREADPGGEPQARDGTPGARPPDPRARRLGLALRHGSERVAGPAREGRLVEDRGHRRIQDEPSWRSSRSNGPAFVRQGQPQRRQQADYGRTEDGPQEAGRRTECYEGRAGAQEARQGTLREADFPEARRSGTRCRAAIDGQVPTPFHHHATCGAAIRHLVRRLSTKSGAPGLPGAGTGRLRPCGAGNSADARRP